MDGISNFQVEKKNVTKNARRKVTTLGISSTTRRSGGRFMHFFKPEILKFHPLVHYGSHNKNESIALLEKG